MIPIKPAPEPKSFDKNVRQPGLQFLNELGISKPYDGRVRIPWKDGRFWRECIDLLEDSYHHTCCYVGMRINNSNSDKHRSVEHFIPKSLDPWLAYEWSNYRLSCRKANTDRGSKTVLDPFLVDPNDFRLDLFSFELFPNPDLPLNKQSEVQATIDNIDLNNSYWKTNRQKYYIEYIKTQKISQNTLGEQFLLHYAPIVLAEINRNVSIIKIMDT